jgi:hypothetical protein
LIRPATFATGVHETSDLTAVSGWEIVSLVDEKP